MNETERTMHLSAGLRYGRQATCTGKIDYKSERTAEKAVEKMAAKGAKPMEAYPCFWCDGWHIGRIMTRSEREQFSGGS